MFLPAATTAAATGALRLVLVPLAGANAEPSLSVFSSRMSSPGSFSSRLNIRVLQASPAYFSLSQPIILVFRQGPFRQ